MANILDGLFQRLQAGAKGMLRQSVCADTKADAEGALDACEAMFEGDRLMAAAYQCLECEELPTFFELPAKHWRNLCTSNPIGSASSTIRPGRRVTRVRG